MGKHCSVISEVEFGSNSLGQSSSIGLSGVKLTGKRRVLVQLCTGIGTVILAFMFLFLAPANPRGSGANVGVYAASVDGTRFDSAGIQNESSVRTRLVVQNRATCSNCGGSVKWSAKACPHCGVGFDGNASVMTPKKWGALIGIGVAVILGLAGFVALGAVLTMISRKNAAVKPRKSPSTGRREMAGRSLNNGASANQRWGAVQVPPGTQAPPNQQGQFPGQNAGQQFPPQTPFQHAPARPQQPPMPQQPPVQQPPVQQRPGQPGQGYPPRRPN